VPDLVEKRKLQLTMLVYGEIIQHFFPAFVGIIRLHENGKIGAPSISFGWSFMFFWVVVSNIFHVHPENWGNDPI